MSICMPQSLTKVNRVDPEQAARLAELPKAALVFTRITRTNGKPYRLYRAEYEARFAITQERIERGPARFMPVVANVVGELEDHIARAGNEGMPLCLLSADVDECDSSKLPVPVVWRLDLARPATAVAGSSGPSVLLFDPKEHVAPKFVAEERCTWRAPLAAVREPLLEQPLVYKHDTYPTVAFNATDAWGFNSADLMQNVAQLLSDGCYYIPSTYQYAALISHVRSALVLARARQHTNALYGETMPEGSHLLTGTRVGYEIDGHELAQAIEFIDTRLLPSLVTINPARLVLSVSPFGAARWLDVWARRNTQNETAKSVALPPTDIKSDAFECRLRIVAFFVALGTDVVEQDDGSRSYVIPPGVQQNAQPPPSFPPPPPPDAQPPPPPTTNNANDDDDDANKTE